MRKKILAIAITLLAMLSSVAFADVVVTQKMTVQSMGMGASEMTITQKIKGDRDYSQVLSKTSGAMGAAAGESMENVMINRLDKGVMWVLSPASKTYKEMKFGELKAMTEAMQQDTSAATEGAGEFAWTVNITDLGEATINGFACRGLKGIATGVSKKVPSEKSRLVYEMWVGKGIAGGDELLKHFEALSLQTGQDQLTQNEMIKKMFAQAGPEFDKLTKAMAELKGFPVKTVISVQSAIKLPDQSDSTGMDPQSKAMMDQMKAMMKEKATSEGMTEVLSMTTNVTAIQTTTVDPAVFDLPAGYAPEL